MHNFFHKIISYLMFYFMHLYFCTCKLFEKLRLDKKHSHYFCNLSLLLVFAKQLDIFASTVEGYLQGK